MSLKVGNIFGKLFEATAEDAEVLGFYGNLRIPQSSGGEKNLFFDGFEGATLDATNWTETIVGSGTINVANGTCILYSGSGGTGDNSAKITSKIRSLRQIVGGDIIIETKVKVANFTDTNGMWFIGLTDSDGTDLAFIGKRINNAGYSWKPRVENDGTTDEGVSESSAENTYLKIKIIIKLYSVEFYIDDVLVETLDGADAIPNDQEMFVYFKAKFGSSRTVTMTIDWVKFQYIGSG